MFSFVKVAFIGKENFEIIIKSINIAHVNVVKLRSTLLATARAQRPNYVGIYKLKNENQVFHKAPSDNSIKVQLYDCYYHQIK